MQKVLATTETEGALFRPKGRFLVSLPRHVHGRYICLLRAEGETASRSG